MFAIKTALRNEVNNRIKSLPEEAKIRECLLPNSLLVSFNINIAPSKINSTETSSL